MVTFVIRVLIALCLGAILFFLVTWVLAAIGLAIPHIIVSLIGIIIVLIFLLWLYTEAKKAWPDKIP